ncbi:MAG: hypothetical protein AB7N65_04485 [Vicinamibacterales bacterium]
MHIRLISACALSGTIALGGWLSTPSVQAQGGAAAPAAKPAAPAKRPLARTPDGHPDIQGTYDVATITPIERPEEFGNRATLTADEATALEQGEAEWKASTLEADKGDRTAPPVGGETDKPKTYLATVLRRGGGVVGGYNTFWLAGGEQVVRIDGQYRTSIVVDPPNGRIPPLKPIAVERQKARLQIRVDPSASESTAAAGPPSAFDNPEARPLGERCILGFGNTSGPPTLPNYFYNNLKQIVQTKDTILIHVEMVHDARIIRMNSTHLPKTVRKWMGDSIGRWEGETLVVDTTNFTDKTVFQGSGENLHVVERFTPQSDGGLLYQFTVSDPDTWDRSWKGEYVWRASNEQIYEYACHEGNHGLVNVLRGARYEDSQKKK